MPAFVAAAGAPAAHVERLRGAFLAARGQSWFGPLAELLLLEGFAEVREESYAPLLQWERAAKDAGFDRPA